MSAELTEEHVEETMRVVTPALASEEVCEALVKAVQLHFTSYSSPRREVCAPAVSALVSILVRHGSVRALILSTVKAVDAVSRGLKRNQGVAAEAGAMPVLVSLIEVKMSDPEVLTACWAALESIVFWSIPIGDRIAEGDLPARLLTVMAATQESNPLRIAACKALTMFTSSSTVARAKFCEGFVNVLLETMNRHPGDAGVTLECLRTLYNTYLPFNEVMLRRLFVASDHHTDNSVVQCDLCNMLWKAASCCTDRGVALVSSGALKRAFRVVERHLSDRSAVWSAVVVFTYLLKFQEHGPLFLSGGGLGRVLAAMEAHSSYDVIHDYAIRVLQLLLECEGGLSALRANGQVVRLLQVSKATFTSHASIPKLADVVLAKLV